MHVQAEDGGVGVPILLPVKGTAVETPLMFICSGEKGFSLL